MIYGNPVSAAASAIGKTIVLQDEKGAELVGVVVDNEIVFDATPNDIRLGKIAATQNGVTIGEKMIPSYNTTEGYTVITNGSEFAVNTKDYAYTKLQAIFCPVNGSIANSVAADKVTIDNKVYEVRSTEVVSSVSPDHEKKQIRFGIVNNSGSIYLIRYFIYKEIY